MIAALANGRNASAKCKSLAGIDGSYIPASG